MPRVARKSPRKSPPLDCLSRTSRISPRRFRRFRNPSFVNASRGTPLFPENGIRVGIVGAKLTGGFPPRRAALNCARSFSPLRLRVTLSPSRSSPSIQRAQEAPPGPSGLTARESPTGSRQSGFYFVRVCLPLGLRSRL